tara:strand:- start:5258 stop:8641 length:3384 start_codon:yes stop_codon:yes gene_type:complete
MKKNILLFLLLTHLTFSWAQQQNVTATVSPEVFNESDVVTLTFNGNSIDESAWGISTNALYLWSWSFDLTDSNIMDCPTNGQWTNSNEANKLTYNAGTDSYSISFTPTTFYNRTNIGKIGFLIKAKDGTGDKKSQDITHEVGAFQLSLTSPIEETTLLDQGDAITISATTSLAANFTLKANGSIINTSSTTTTNYSYNYTVTENTNFVLEATDGTTTLFETFKALINPTVIEQELPTGMMDGINLDPLDNTKATLVLYAPGKEFVHLIGDFNDWQITNSYLLKKDTAKNRFWIELNGLTPQTDHMYQYLVEYELNIADPYSTLILDPYNDQYINSTTFPNLPSYPSGKTTEAVTLLRTGDNPYTWSNETLNFTKPAKTDLVIYEILLRDFDALHSFDALRTRLDYLQSLGINAIELMPVSEFDGNESWGYNPSFHMALDKYYGNPEALKQIIDECHKRGMAVILDVVYNHASGQNPYFRLWNDSNGGTGGKATADNPFFNSSAKHSYSVFNDYNHQSQATKDYVNRTVRYWIEEFKIDGMRWDLTKGFTQNCSESDENCTNTLQQDRVTVLQGYADTQWSLDSNFYVIFEHLGVFQEEEQWANYRSNDGKGILLWNKQTGPYNEATMGYHQSGVSDLSGVSYQTKGFNLPAAVSYMESHDEERLMFKNLNFGNANNDYNTKSLNTALERMQTAGAFFFTVPGPKMIWQFGELGYDVSIDQNGRTGNKPIRWEYYDNPERKAIYDLWSKLIELKVEESIFETTDFTLNTAATTGLKSIHLNLASAPEGEIKYVTIIGNFGITEQAINPQFQQSGVWYEFLNNNLKYNVVNKTDPINLAPGEFRIFGDQPSVLFPNDNQPDDDNDGVNNTDDICPDTPFGDQVNVSGCTVFSLPASNFNISTYSETCRASDNGQIIISAFENYTYTATLIGPKTEEISFTGTVEFSDLVAGSYSVCITLTEEPNYKQCFNLNISEPEDLSVSSKIDTSGKQITLNLKGGDSYSVQLNNKRFTTTQDQITLELNQEVNTLSVKTDLDCQGLYEETIVINNTVRVYPNPITNDELFLAYGNEHQAFINLAIYTSQGAMVYSSNINANDGIERLQLDQLAKGLYILEIKSKTETQVFKILKK